MREILFRGKTIAHPPAFPCSPSEWVYGPHVPYIIRGKDNLEMYIGGDKYHSILVELAGSVIIRDVLPETVEQYTGCTDCEGNKIFKGDLRRDANGSVYEIVWSNYFLTWELHPFSDKYPDNYVQDLFEFIDKKNVAKDLKIIGNRYDNPELWEVTNE